MKYLVLVVLVMGLCLPSVSTARLVPGNGFLGVGPCKPSLIPSVSDGNFRYATAEDAAAISNANVGDYILDGKNNNSGMLHISTSANWDNSFTLGPGKKILIKGGNYQKIYLDIPDVVGSAAEPVIITNYDGQVATRQLIILGARHFKLTGRYDPVAQTGDPNYLGWQSTVGHYQAQFGFDIRNMWTNTSDSSLKIVGHATDYELEYLEVGDGGFAGMSLKTDDDDSVNMDNVSIHHNYIHDTEGEGIYLGSTQEDPQHQFNNLHIHNNVIARAGLNTLQVGQLSENVLIEHNALVMGTTNWKNPFMITQDEAVQWRLRRGGTTFRDNIVVGGAKLLGIGFLTPKPGLPLDPDSSFVIEHNLFYAVRSNGAVYIGNRGDEVTPILVRDNYVGQIGGDYHVVYPTHSFDGSWMLASFNNQSYMTATNNLFDATASQPLFDPQGMAQITELGSSIGLVPAPQFHNFMELPADFDYRAVERWNAFVGESDRFPAQGTNKGDPIVYNVGSLVLYHGYLYRSLQANNHNHVPTGATDSWWQRVTFQSSGGPCIPDDLRLPVDDFYAQQGIGLEEQIPNQATNWVYLPTMQR